MTHTQGSTVQTAFQGKELCQREVEAAIREEKLAEEAADEDSFGNSKVERVRRALWNLLEYPGKKMRPNQCFKS